MSLGLTFDVTSPTRADVLKGAGNIAAFLLGDHRRRREVYYLVERAKLPVFRLGAMICARRSTLEAWICDQEAECSGRLTTPIAEIVQ